MATPSRSTPAPFPREAVTKQQQPPPAHPRLSPGEAWTKQHPPPRPPPRLIRPSKDGQEGGWSYLFHANGEDFIFPALVNELGSLRSLILTDVDRQIAEEPAPEPGDGV